MNAERRTKTGEDVADLRIRTKQYALRVIRLYTSLSKDTVSQVLGRQLLRSGTSVGAHHREASRSRSVAEFVSKMEGALQELDETAYWLELLVESKTVSVDRLAALLEETDQLIAIFVASVKTSKLKRSY
jgi:four helix bundle protein